MIFKEYIIPETQKEKFALAIKLAKDFNEKYVVMDESPRIRTKKHLPVENGVKKIVEFIMAVDVETMVVFFKCLNKNTVTRLINISEILNNEMIKLAMICFQDEKFMINKIVRAKEIRNDGEIIMREEIE